MTSLGGDNSSSDLHVTSWNSWDNNNNSSDMFCEDKLWNTDLLVQSSWPRLTSCFQYTVLVYAPFGLLWLPLPFHLLSIKVSKDRPLPISCTSATKMVIAFTLAIISAVLIVGDLGSSIKFHEDISLAEYVSYVVRLASYIVMGLLVPYERRCRVTSSGVLFITWFFVVICDVVPFYSKILLKEYEDSLLKFCVFALLYGLEVVMFLLHIKGDNSGIGDLPARTSPEVTTSFIGKYLYTWIARTVFMGWRKDLEERDLFDLNPEYSTGTIMPDFEKKWRHEVSKCKKKRLKQIYRVEKRALASSSHSLQLTEHAEKEKLVDNVSNSNYNTMDLGEGKKQKKVIPSLLKVLIKIGAKDLSIGFMQKCVADLLTMLSPIILSLLISYSSQSTSGDDQWKGYCLAALMFVSQGVKSVVFNGSFWKSQVYGMNLKTILISAIYKKALTMNNEAKKESTIGEIVSLMSVDCQRIQDCMNAFFLGATAPIQVAAIIAVLYMYIGVSVFAGLFVLILTIPLNSYLTTVQQKLQSENLKVKDARLRLTNEALSGMKVLKLYAWEEAFQAKITDLRSQETVVLMKIAYINMITSICFNAVPFFVTLATFAMYVNLSDENVLDANIAFVSLSFFSILRVPLSLLSTVLSMTIQAIVSIGRVNEYLCVGDLNPDNISKNNNSEYAIDIEKGTFTWDRQAPPTLRNVTMKVTPGQLFAVVGQVGSGKSSLMSALLGEMERLSGTASLKGTVAYVPQQAWIQNATVRDNILFGKPYNRKRYTRVIQACALERDLEILSAGDMTEIGEKGINLSGGQKQRVSLARAVYSGADTYVFDDPLSAVDTHVGKHIFNKVISQKGVLKGKTRVLVTHGVHRLPMVDTSLRVGSSLRARMELESRITRVLVTHGVHWLPMVDTILVVEDGTVTENGSYEELMCNDGPFAQFIRTYLLNDDDDDEDGVNQDPEIRAMRAKILSDVETMTSEGLSSDNEALRPSKKPVAGIRRRGMVRQESKTYDSIYPSGAFMQSRMSVYEDENGSDETRGKLVVDEKVEKGKVKRAVFGAFIKAAGVLPFLFSLLLFCGYQVFSAMANYWLAGWTSDPSLLNVTLRGSQEFKDKNDFYLFIFGLFGVAQVAFLIGYNVLYWIRVVIAAKNLHFSMLKSVLRSPMAFFDTTPLGRIMNRFSRDIEVVDNTLPIIIRDGFNTFTVVISTIIIISINTPLFLTLMGPLFVFYVLVQNFYIATSRQLKRLESVTRSPIYSHFSETITGGPVIRAYDVTKRFVGICNARVDRNQALYYASMGSNRWLGANLDVVANIVVFSSALFAVLTPGTNGATIGLSVTYAIQASSSLVWMVRQMSDLETNIVSVERLKEYSEVPSEAEWILPHRRPKSSWPEKGEVEFNSYKTMYRPGLDLVLKGISCTFKPGEKVGIVGRTGAGKSSLALALFRLIEAFEGEIIVDGINLSHIGLHDVRSNLTILPQDPVLFFGTVRMNLDPLDEYSDDQLWESLTSAHLGDFVRSLPGGLEYMVGEEGQSLSVGQRQLVCLARALLKNTKILILDEATAAVDMETDTLIQNTIRSEFEGCTIITIAHRLNTIMDYDRVMVLDAGHIKEFDTPPNLLGDTTTAFFSMAREANLV